MLLRRLSKHVEDQNWLAVGLDFLIVVLGVFIGIQLGNWNEGRAAKREYERAVDRYVVEAKANLDTLNTLEQAVSRTLIVIGQSLDALQTCQDTPENIARVEAGLANMVIPSGLSIETSALEELTTAPHLLAQQSTDMRKLFSETKFRADIVLAEVNFIKQLPLEEPMQNNPIVRIGPLDTSNFSYDGDTYARPDRPIRLTVPISEACKNDQLIKAFYTWEQWQGTLPAVARVLRHDIEENLAVLEKRS